VGSKFHGAICSFLIGGPRNTPAVAGRSDLAQGTFLYRRKVPWGTFLQDAPGNFLPSRRKVP
jgi:hypothetical protein